MSPVSASAITIADGEITIDAELLTPKLSLSSNTEHPSLLGIVREMNTSGEIQAIIRANHNTAT